MVPSTLLKKVFATAATSATLNFMACGVRNQTEAAAEISKDCGITESESSIILQFHCKKVRLRFHKL